MIPFVLLGAILWAGTATIPDSVKHYFRAQLAYTLVVWPAVYILGDKSTAYLVVFAALTAMILLFSAEIIMDFLSKVSIKWFAVVCGLFSGASMTWMAMANLGRPLQPYDYVGFAEAGLLTSYGAILGITTRFVSKRKRLIAVTLAIVWLLEAGFGYGYFMSYGNPFWERQNWFTPAYLLIGAFLFLGWKLRQKEYVLNL